jgi:hypothetical protein
MHVGVPPWLANAINAPLGKRAPYLEGRQISLWMPSLKGFPVMGACLLTLDPLADKTAFDGKILGILRSQRITFRVRDIIHALQEAGLGKETKALGTLVPQALQRLKRRGLVKSGGRFWVAASYQEAAAM